MILNTGRKLWVGFRVFRPSIDCWTILFAFLIFYPLIASAKTPATSSIPSKVTSPSNVTVSASPMGTTSTAVSGLTRITELQIRELDEVSQLVVVSDNPIRYSLTKGIQKNQYILHFPQAT